MTNDKPKREDAPIAWRVSDEELANLTFKMSDPIALFKLAENLELDLQDERKRSKRLAKANAELIEERDHARTALATLGHENDALREREKELEEYIKLHTKLDEQGLIATGNLMRKYSALRDAVSEFGDSPADGSDWESRDRMFKLAESADALKSGDTKSGGGESRGLKATDHEADKTIEAEDRPAASDYSTPAQILVRGGKPDIFRGAWIASLTPEHPLWPVWKRASRGDACVSADGMPDGLYTVVDCEVCSNTQCRVCGYYCLGNGGHGCVDKPTVVLTCPHCHEGKTLLRESEEG